MHASLFITGQLRNPWQMLAKSWGSAEPRLKNTVLMAMTTNAKIDVLRYYIVINTQ